MKDKYKLIMFDIDGVLNEHGGNILPESKEAIKILRERDVRVCFASGKHAWYIQGGLVWSGLLQEDTLIVAENGGVVYDPQSRKTILEDKYLKDAKLLRNIFYNLYKKREGFLHFAGLTVWEEPKETLFCLFPKDTNEVPKLAKIIQEIVDINKLNLYLVENPDSVDVLQEGINKATGIQHVCDWLNISMKDIIAIGDSYNDIEMLEAIDFGITLDNGKPEIKDLIRAKADKGYIASKACGKGVLEAVEYLIKNDLI